MILSHTWRFIFIKTSKTAGTSTEIALASVCGIDDIVTPINNPEGYPHTPRNYEGGYHNHMPASEILELCGAETFNSYYKFCTERNPLDKVISQYYWQCYYLNTQLDFNQYLHSHLLPCDWHKYTLNGKLCVDRVMRYETLASDFAEVLQTLGMPPLDIASIKAKSGFRRGNIRLKRKEKQHVRRAFVREALAFGYMI